MSQLDYEFINIEDFIDLINTLEKNQLRNLPDGDEWDLLALHVDSVRYEDVAYEEYILVRAELKPVEYMIKLETNPENIIEALKYVANKNIDLGRKRLKDFMEGVK